MSFEALIRFSAKRRSGEPRRWHHAVLFAKALAGHAGGKRGCEVVQLEPFLLRWASGFRCGALAGRPSAAR